MTHLLLHPLWPLFLVWAKGRKNRGIDFPGMPQTVKVSAVLVVMECVYCGRVIHPIRERKKLKKKDVRQGHLGPLFYSGTCPSTVNPGCSRTTAASEDIDRMLAAIRERDL